MSASNEDKSITYQYDANGLRYKKIVDGVEHTYYYMGDKLVRMTVGTDKVMDFTYDQNGQPYSVTYNGTKAYYVLNQQGDVVRIVTAGGASRGVYYYDAWGNILYNTDNDFLNYNPLRYRGYVYDTETQLYYCQSRYYDPALGRFLNADAFTSTGQGILGNNMFAYCNNNPVIYVDSSGTVAETVFDVASLIISAVEVAANPTDLGAWVGLLGDAVDLVPFVTGVGESIRALRSAEKIADGADAAIDSYRNLRKLNKGKGKEVHHILEKRFAAQLKPNTLNTDDMLSIALSKADHKKYTSEWRALQYGVQHGFQDVLRTGAQIYSDNPKLMAAFLLTMEKLQ